MAEPVAFNDRHVAEFDLTRWPAFWRCSCYLPGLWVIAEDAGDAFHAYAEHKAEAWDRAEAAVEAEYERQREAGLL